AAALRSGSRRRSRGLPRATAALVCERRARQGARTRAPGARQGAHVACCRAPVPGDALARPDDQGDAVSSDPDVVGQAYALCAPGECRDAGESVVLGSVAVANYRTGKDPSSPHMAVWTLGDG